MAERRGEERRGSAGGVAMFLFSPNESIKQPLSSKFVSHTT